MLNTIYALKKSMRQEFVAGKRTPVTLLSVPAHSILGTRQKEKDGYTALILGIGQAKGTPAKKSLQGKFKSWGTENQPLKIKEVRSDSIDSIADEKSLNLESILTKDSKVKVSGRSKGKGFAGVIKRWGFSTQPRTHGQSDRHRAPGSIGRGTTPGRVVKGKKMAGHMGFEIVSVKNLKVISFNPESGELALSGSVPGRRNTWLKVTVTNPPKTVSPQ
ncbi:50S ribosomal protein L3 [Candidatus Collierbacteria bacterium]|nr:50S ribosomal protein L3 [Candidatus Collierbacteria bacterium]